MGLGQRPTDIQKKSVRHIETGWVAEQCYNVQSSRRIYVDYNNPNRKDDRPTPPSESETQGRCSGSVAVVDGRRWLEMMSALNSSE